MATVLSSNVEFIASNSAAYTAVGGYAVLASFGTSTANIVSVTISAASTLPQTIDAGAYSHLTYTGAAGTYATAFDIGYSSTYATGSKYNNSANTTLSSGNYANTTEGYGTLELSGALVTKASSISFAGIDNTLVLDTTALTIYPVLTGFGAAGDQVVFNGVAAAGASITGYSYAAGVGLLTIRNNGISTTLTLNNVASTTAIGNFSLGSSAAVEGGNTSTYSGNLVLTFVPCFLRGTLIDTPFGERPVEDLREGDLVIALVDGRPVPRPVRWAGSGSMDAAQHAFRDSAFPVRIRRDAFADNVPYRDLLVTPEHCVLTEAGLVPARMLVNGSSVVIDRDLVEYEYFHIELPEHAIILSDGLATESYLDGENRLHLDRVASEREPAMLAAPLAVSRALVEPIWCALRNRAAVLGMPPASVPASELTDDPALRLLLDDGSEIAACRRDSQRHMFQIPRGTRPLRLRSRASVPSEVIGPFVDDRRRLGVAVDRMVLWTGLDERPVASGGTGDAGWHAPEPYARWTDGDGALDLPIADEDRFLDVHLAGTLPYRAA